jgi:cytochrome c biogenesis protein CcmG, thiol:disulfide interchange protein DsbE
MSTVQASPGGPGGVSVEGLSSSAPGPSRRRRHTARWVAGAVLAVLVVVAVVAATRPTYQAASVASPLVGAKAPLFSGTDLAGQHVALSAYRGRYVYVNFFASWCPPCQVEEEDLVAFNFQQEKAASSGAALVSVIFNDTDAAAAQFVSTWGAQWPAVPDRDGTIANAYGVGSPPMSFLVDPRGYIVGVWDGPVTTSQLDSMLDQARRAGD